MGIKILLADDSMTAQNMGKKILSEAGHEVFTVSNGAAAAKKIAEIKPELVLLDVFMPGYSGLELCERLRNAAETARLPVLLTVGRMEPYNPQDGARVKADGVIVKPFEASDLTAAVDRLLEKAKPAKKHVAYEPTVKIAPPSGYKDESHLAFQQQIATEEGESALPAANGEPAAYEPTLRLDAAQIAAMLKNAGGVQSSGNPVQEFSAPVPVHSAEEYTVAPAAETVAFEGELTPDAPSPESRRIDIPSYMAQYLDEASSSRKPAPAEPPTTLASGASPFEPVMMHPEPVVEAAAPTIALSDATLLQRFDAAANPEAPVAAADGLELTAAAPVPDVPIAQETGFEATAQSFDAPTFVLKDPALVTDPHAANMDFATRFGTADDPGSAEQFLKSLYGATETTAAPVDEFEARLNAAMSSYEAPATDLPMLDAEPTPLAASQSEHTARLKSPTAESFEAQVETAMQSFEASTSSTPAELAEVWYSHAEAEIEQTAPEDAPVAAIEAETPNFTATFEVPRSEAISVEPGIEAAAPRGNVEITAGFLERSTAQNLPEELPTVEAVSNTVVSEREPFAVEPIAPDTDEAVIQQMREAFSHLPIDSPQVAESSGSVPMAMAAAASTAPAIATAPAPLGGEAELEIANALAAAVGVVAPVGAAAASPTPETDETLQSARDANKVAAAVEKVMQRELPTLIWKIMAELDLRKR